MAIEKHGQITGDPRHACVFIKIHKYIASSPVQNLNNLLRLDYQPLFGKLTAGFIDLALLISTNKKSACLNRAGCIN